MTNDLFLQWLGERTRGSWELFKAAHTWLFAQNSAMNRNLRPTWTAYLLASLGHIEVDWRDGKWSVAAPTIAGLPSAGATAVLIGARPRILVERFDRYTSPDRTSDLIASTYTPPGAPTSIYVQYESAEAVTELAARIGASFEPVPAQRLSTLLPSLESLVDSARTATEPPRGYSAEWLDPNVLNWVEAVKTSRPGLYRYRGYGFDQFRYYDGATWREIDRDLGVWAALSRTRRDLITFEREEVNGTLVVPFVGRLPLLHARAAVLCSGLPPSNVVHGWIRYVNVPSSIASRIARSLGQSLDATGSGAMNG